MLNQIPETMPEEHYALGSLNLLFFAIWAIILIGWGILFLLKAKKQKVQTARSFKLAFGMFGIFYGFCRVFFILMFHIEPEKYYDIFAALAYFTGLIGFTFIVWALEKVWVMQSKSYDKNYFFLVSLIVTLVALGGLIMIFLGFNEIRETILTVIFIGTPISGLLIFILYVSLIRLSTGIVQKRAIYSLIGLFIMVIGITLDSQFFLALEFIPNWFKMDVVPLIAIGGYLIFAYINYK